jgi:hypothetical protein
MNKAIAVIKKVGNKFCVFSKDGKNLGCSTSRDGAEKRLRQVEHFKNKGSRVMNYDMAFDNFAKALHKDLVPENGVEGQLRVGTIAGFASDKLLDKREHFPVITHTQAQSSMARVMQLTDVPVWYRGSLADLRHEVYAGIMKVHPDIELNVRVPAEVAVALSDGETPAATSKVDIKDPDADRKRDEVPQVNRPTLTSAEVEEALDNEDHRKAIAGRLMEMIDKQIEHMQAAKKLGQRLLKNGLKAEEFDQLSTFIQEDILRELMSRGVTASAQAAEDRRQELLGRLNKKSD